MLRVPVDKIQPGMILARPIPLPQDPHRMLLQRDREIPMDLVPRLRELGVFEVWVRHHDLEFLEDLIDPGLGEHQRAVYAHVRQNFAAMAAGSTVGLDVAQFQTSVSGLFGFLRESRTSNLLLQKLEAYDNYLMSHSANVCYLSLLLGMKLERYLIEERSSKRARDAKDIRQLGLGCILHDVGKMMIDPKILNKPGKLTPEEMEVIKTHPTLGYQMVRGKVPAAAAQVVLNHHQRFCGGGYPERVDPQTGEKLPSLCGRQIPIFCRIATVCDVYDAATTQRVYSAPKTSVQALHEMRTFCRDFFDPQILQAFLEIVPPFPIGKIVKLSDGSQAAVVDFNPRLPVDPKVQCLRYPNGEKVANPSLEEIDLAIYDDLEIVEVDGQDITEYLATHREAEEAAFA